MKLSIALACVLFMANSILAQSSYVGAMRQAKNVSNKVTEQDRQLLDKPPAAPPPSNPNPPTDPALQATLQNIANLRADFAAVAIATNSLNINKQSLTNDLALAAQGTKPQPASVSKLADDLTTTIAGKEKLRAPQPKLAQYVHAIFNSSHLTAAQQQMIFDGVQKILTDGGASPEETVTVVSDIKTIASETK